MKKTMTRAMALFIACMMMALSVAAALPAAGAEEWGDAPYATVTTIRKSNGFGEEITQIPFEQGAGLPGSKYLVVNEENRGQTMLGLGGAMTESAAYNLSKLTEEQQAEVYEAYYGESGAKYALTRSSIGSADFSTRSYSYDDSKTADPELTQFTIEKDMDYIIPAIQRILAVNPDVKFFAAPWAPPAWMKKSGKRQGGVATAGISLVNNSVLPKYYQSYANYFVKYIQAYAEQGIKVYSLSMQNESQNNPKWECATWTISAAIDFIANYLGPTLEANGIDTKLVIWDWDKGNDTLHKDGFINYNTGILSHANARKYIDGIAFHWYAGDLWHEIAGKPMWSEDFYSLDTVKNQFPDIHLYATEACQEKGSWFGSYEPAYRYIHDILNDFEHGTECFIDWNLVLDYNGGPTQGVENKCHAPVMLDQNNNVCYQPSYYVMKMISRAVQPGTVHIETVTDQSIDKTAVIDENGIVSVLLGNTGDKAKSLTLVDGDWSIKVDLPANSLTTVTYAQPGGDEPEECDHVWGGWLYKDEGAHYRVCALNDEHIEMGEHDFQPGEAVSAATCAAVGSMKLICADCGGEKLMELPIDPENHTGNTLVKDAKAPTCAQPGYTGDTYCADCGEKLSIGEAIAKTAHTPVAAPDLPATNTTSGKTGGSTCSVCGQVVEAPTVIPAISSVTLYKGIDKTYRLTSGEPASWKLVSGILYGSVKGDVVTVRLAGTIKVKDSKSGKTVTITVKKPSLTVSSTSLTVKKGAAAQLTASPVPEAKVEWSTGKASIATVDENGKVTGVKAGSCTIYAKAHGITKSIKVTVK